MNKNNGVRIGVFVGLNPSNRRYICKNNSRSPIKHSTNLATIHKHTTFHSYKSPFLVRTTFFRFNPCQILLNPLKFQLWSNHPFVQRKSRKRHHFPMENPAIQGWQSAARNPNPTGTERSIRATAAFNGTCETDSHGPGSLTCPLAWVYGRCASIEIYVYT